MAYAEDLSPFFDPEMDGDTATLDGASVNGIYQNGFAEAFGMAGHDARFTLPEAATGTTNQASVLVVRGLTYRVRSVQPDGTGVCTLLLERQP